MLKVKPKRFLSFHWLFCVKLADAVFGLAVEMVALFLETERFEQGMQIFDDLGKSLCGVGALHIFSPMTMPIKGAAAFQTACHRGRILMPYRFAA